MNKHKDYIGLILMIMCIIYLFIGVITGKL